MLMRVTRTLAIFLHAWLIMLSVMGLPLAVFVGVTMIDLIRPLTAHAATTYYVATNGNDTTGTGSSAQPWLTWTKALSVAVCGDTILAKNGTYPVGTHGRIIITGRTCTSGARLVLRPENSRMAWLQGTGNPNQVVDITSSHYITVQEFRITSTDNNAVSGGGFGVVNVKGATNFSNPSSNIQILGNIISNNNRYQNCHLLVLTATNSSLVQGNEFYNFHRHAVVVSANSLNNVVRRNYANSRNWSEIPGGFDAGPGTQTRGGDAFVVYTTGGTINSTGNIFENNISEKNGKGFGMESVSRVIGMRYLGNISLDDTFGLVLKARPEQNHQPEDSIVTDFVAIRPETVGIYLRGNRNTQVTNATLYDSVSNSGFIADVEGCSLPAGCIDGSGTVSAFGTNILSTLNTTGIHIVLTNASDPINGIVDAWTMTNVNSVSNSTTNFNPASSNPNYVTPRSEDPELGDCRVFRPDGSNAKDNGYGADILFRYEDGILTTTPLWDPTTGEFPHGVVIAGVNDTASTSLYNVHQRLNIPYPGDSHNCNWPASFPGGTPPQNPATHIASSGTTSTTHDHDLTAGTDLAVGQCITLLDLGGNVGDVATATSGGEALTLGGTVVSSPAYRRSSFYYKLAPTTGVRSQVVTTTGNVDQMVTISMELYNAAAVGTTATATGRSATPSVNVSIGSGQTIVDCLSVYGGTTLTAGPNQTLQKKYPEADTAPQRAAVSSQSSTDGVQVGYTIGTAASWWTLTATPFCAVSCSAGTNALNVTKYGFFSGFGSEAGSAQLPNATTFSTPYKIAPNSMVRVRAEITAEVDTSPPFGFSLYCRKNAESYTQVVNSFGSGVVRLYGGGVEEFVPSSLTPTTPRLTAPDGNSVAGVMIRDAASTFITPQMASGKRIEMEWVIVTRDTLVPNVDTVDCQPRFDSGTGFTTYTVTPRLNIITPAAAGFASLPQQPWGLTATPDPIESQSPLHGWLANVPRNLSFTDW